jgi:hypothetical protein
MEESEGSQDRRYRRLVERLSQFPADEIISFDSIEGELLEEAYRWDLWAAAHIISGGCSDDSFQDFRRWLISRGKDAFYAAMADPESLLKWQEGEDDIYFEAFGWIPGVAYKIQTGRELYGDVERASRISLTRNISRSGPKGVKWQGDEDLRKRFPKLSARFWGNER